MRLLLILMLVLPMPFALGCGGGEPSYRDREGTVEGDSDPGLIEMGDPDSMTPPEGTETPAKEESGDSSK